MTNVLLLPPRSGRRRCDVCDGNVGSPDQGQYPSVSSNTGIPRWKTKKQSNYEQGPRPRLLSWEIRRLRCWSDNFSDTPPPPPPPPPPLSPPHEVSMKWNGWSWLFGPCGPIALTASGGSRKLDNCFSYCYPYARVKRMKPGRVIPAFPMGP